MAEVAVALVWHQHQPYYPDDVAGQTLMPWVRLHGVKDYYGMAMLLHEFPEVRCTINLVPSLLKQLLQYTEQGRSDRHQELTRVPADGLSQEQVFRLLDDFFMAHHATMIRPWPRYEELYRKRQLGQARAQDVWRRFDTRDLRDLQVLFNLAWIHPIAFEKNDGLRSLRHKGRYFTEEEKLYVLDQHVQLLQQVIPLHRQLAQRGQVELTTTPFYHPIVPLLLDKRYAREAMPEVRLPRFTIGYPEDVEWHLREAVQLFQSVFGWAPAGMWPSEGSVCQGMIPHVARAGFRWMATDEEILYQSTNGLVRRDAKGYIVNPQEFYRPYRVVEGDAELDIVFRDHALSDLIGFHYYRSSAELAAEDFLGKLRSIRTAIAESNSRLPLVSVILDGENCWEYYAEQGVPFLRALYRRLAHTKGVRTVRVADYLQENPARVTLPRLFAGSWIHHNFDIWIGHEEDNSAWDLLHLTREYLKSRQARGVVPAETLKRAWEEIYVAEGSDWFWWYGPQHSSPQDALFDYLFRKHLQNVYFLLGEEPPVELARPISKRAARVPYTLPRSFLEVRINGRRTPIEWLGAGRYLVEDERGTMAMAAPGPLQELYFGFTPRALILRVDFRGPARDLLADYDAVRIGFVAPAGRDLWLLQPGRTDQQIVWNGQNPKPVNGVEVGLDQVLELAIPFEELGVTVDQPIQFFVELLEGKQSRDRAPRYGTIDLTCPSPDFERIMWDV
ncbi:MAG: alpha-amylase/alpha-mannosidase [Gemmataceae bacterium]